MNDAAEPGNYTVPDPFAFNFTIIPARCQGYCPVFSADYGPFTGANGSAQLELPSGAQVGQYFLQIYFFDAAIKTQVVFGDSSNFTIMAPQGDPIKPFDEYDSSMRNASFFPLLSLVIVLSVALILW